MLVICLVDIMHWRIDPQLEEKHFLHISEEKANGEQGYFQVENTREKTLRKCPG